MRNWTLPKGAARDIAILLLPRFSNHCLANAVEPLRAANELLATDAYRWRFVTLDGEPVTSSSGLPVSPKCRLRDHPGGEMLFVMSSYDVRAFATPATSRALRGAAGRFRVLAGMDTAAWLMAEAQLLDGRPATIHREEQNAFSEAFPSVHVKPSRFVIDGDMITCGGAMTAFDLVLELIGRAHGEAIAQAVSAFFLHSSAGRGQEMQPRGRVSPVVEAALTVMAETLEAPLPIAALAARLGTTQRSLARAFAADLGASPRTVYKRQRLVAARRFAEGSRYTIAEIAVRCGYRSAASMTRAFVKEFGRPPTSVRTEVI
ncbi:MAG: helix-turn-helix domain-containing protein [Pseudomonadota bacterium]